LIGFNYYKLIINSNLTIIIILILNSSSITMAHINKAELKKQVEYYLSDKNLMNDRFFHEKISESKDGFIDLTFILSCNKIKQFKLKDAPVDIADAVKESAEVELSADLKQIRRKGSKALPELSAQAKKRDAKAASKEESKKESKGGEEEDKLPELDARGNPILSNNDFENPIIIHFKAEKPAEGFKISWKDVETAVRREFPRLKIVYSRSDPTEGDLAFSSHRLHGAELEKLTATTLKVQEHDVSFSKTLGEELKTFWQKQGGHYQFCI